MTFTRLTGSSFWAERKFPTLPGWTTTCAGKFLKKICQKETPCLLVSRNLPVPVELKEAAEAAGTPILISNDATTYLMSMITQYLAVKLAERSSVHGVLVEVFGMGVLLTGESGVGKSETALALVQHGHRLIADDRVDVYQRDHETVVGEAPRILKHLMEIRGIGIIDVLKLFGIGAIKDETEISLVINLTNWDSKATMTAWASRKTPGSSAGSRLPRSLFRSRSAGTWKTSWKWPS